MRYEQITGMPLFEMAIDKKVATTRLSGLAYPLSEHLLKLAGVDPAARDQANKWPQEVRSWLRQIAVLRLKPKSQPLPAKMVFDRLWRDIFEGNEEGNVKSIIAGIVYDGNTRRPDRSDFELALRLKRFHEQFAQMVGSGAVTEEALNGLISELRS